MKVFVTGGAGFIGSHLVDALMARGFEVAVLDNLSSGRLDNVARWLCHSNFKFIEGDLLSPVGVSDVLSSCDFVYHLAANPDVRVGLAEPSIHFRENVLATFNLLEALRLKGWKGTFVFTSSSTVYGEAETPTSENALLKPISVYGASKLASESLIMAYARSYGFRALILRLANVVGFRSAHGVVWDFVRKLRENPRELEILGDGTQKKSYLHVSDCVEALLLSLTVSFDTVEVFNLGSEDQVDVLSIAKTVADEMGLKSVRFRFSGGVDGGRGWVSDVKDMWLDVSKIKRYGWKPKLGSAEAVKLAVKENLSCARS